AAAHGNVQLSSGENTVINAGNGLSTFAQRGDMRHIAHFGQLLLQAQHSNVRIEAEKSVEITASEKHVQMSAEKLLSVLCSGGSIKMQGGNIELGGPGTLTVKAADHRFLGPGYMSAAMNEWSSSKFDERFQVVLPDGTPAANHNYIITRSDGGTIEGITGPDGHIDIQRGIRMESISLEVFPVDEEQQAEGKKS
ncbi:DUF2345 domain-containing protein, partial [Pseudomonas sp. B3G-3]